MSSFGAARRADVFTLDSFGAGFDLDEFIGRLCRDFLSDSDLGSGSSGRLRSPGGAMKASEARQRVAGLLAHIERYGSRVRTLHDDVLSQVQESQQKLESEQQEVKGVLGVVEEELDKLRDGFHDLDRKVANFGRTTATIGERLKRSHERQSQARHALQLIEHLNAFSNLPAGSDLSSLPALFTDEARMPEAAATAQQLLSLTSDLRTAKQHAGVTDKEDSGLGTLDNAVSRLESYCNQLEARVVHNFDEAAEFCNQIEMAKCAFIMAELHREAALAQRYISSRDMFMNPKELRFGESTPFQSSAAAMNDLQAMYRDILTVAKQEAQVIDVVFPNPGMVMKMFLIRVMEQQARSALDRILLAPVADCDPAELRSYLRLVADVYEKTHTLAVNLERSTKQQLDLVDLADSLFADYLGEYPEIELKWMAGMYERQEANDEAGALNLDMINTFIEWNKEALAHCRILVPSPQIPHHVRQLFHSSTYYHANMGCLLEQIARHTMRGMEKALDDCEIGCSTPFSSSSLGDAAAKSVTEAAGRAVERGVGNVLKAVATISSILQNLKEYYTAIIMPLVMPSIAEVSACRAGMAALVKAVEERLLLNLNQGLKHFFAQMDKGLVNEQRRAEFRPYGVVASGLDQPTKACRLAAELCRALGRAAKATLEGTNLESFLSEAGCQMHETLLNHLTRFTISPMGALKLKRDMAEYVGAVRTFGLQPLEQLFEHLQQLANVFIVAPESLVALVDGTLRMSHKEAMKYIHLREDFRSARVEGRSLAQLFASDIGGLD
ncbi:unnamed protein product [Ostreobium quekettii]|uniref:Exocyst complex component Sec10 n=1 Tax=Ostreobium quekettii TaxID=121088 RepID=A0A8S1IRT4_9CHLO|nr:unnamed protein product [Ostreobium quekettii]|eukprot:evm.model.scf_210.7 EVM.evm.TU.scf_210.7   scf_210:81208-91298(-)